MPKSSVENFSSTLRELKKAGVPVVVKQNASGSLYTVATKNGGVPIFTVTAEVATELGLTTKSGNAAKPPETAVAASWFRAMEKVGAVARRESTIKEQN
jgi:hypothetical protein